MTIHEKNPRQNQQKRLDQLGPNGLYELVSVKSDTWCDSVKL